MIDGAQAGPDGGFAAASELPAAVAELGDKLGLVAVPEPVGAA